MTINHLLILLTCISIYSCQYLNISHPSDLSGNFPFNRIKVSASPIGFKPRAGTIHGKLIQAQPFSACSDISQVQFDQQQDIFILADGQECLESVKAHNLAASGAYVGIIRHNKTNKFNDKTVDIVHIPILQIQSDDFDTIVTYMKKNPQTTISMLADFNIEKKKKINMELWLSPTQQDAYAYILQFWQFIVKQTQIIQFHPRFVLHSQTNRKQYIGCYSSGKFCPPQLQFEGKSEGSKIVGEVLRQIIIIDKFMNKWFDYAQYFYNKCLKGNNAEQLWQKKNSQLCSEGAMMSVSISSQEVFQQYNKSFQGPRPQVDGNFYLQQQRQLFLLQKVTTFPILLVNGKQYDLDDPDEMKLRICTMIHPQIDMQSDLCQELFNPPVFSTGELFFALGIMIIVMVVVMCVCKQTIYRKMKRQMQGEVDKTLSQYYRYMETFEESDPAVTTGVIKEALIEPKEDHNQKDSVELSQIKSHQ